MPARPCFARTPLLLHAAPCAGDHACPCVHALASLISSSLRARAQAQSPPEPGRQAGRAGRGGRSGWRRGGGADRRLPPLWRPAVRIPQPDRKRPSALISGQRRQRRHRSHGGGRQAALDGLRPRRTRRALTFYLLRALVVCISCVICNVSSVQSS